MSKNIIIKEDGVDVSITGANKIKTPKQSGGTMLWVPEDETNAGTITITKSATYQASDNNLYAFSKAIVNVEQKTHVSGKGTDGNYYDVTVDQSTGNLVYTPI